MKNGWEGMKTTCDICGKAPAQAPPQNLPIPPYYHHLCKEHLENIEDTLPFWVEYWKDPQIDLKEKKD